MDGIKYVVVTDKSIRVLVKNQYTSNVESGSIKIFDMSVKIEIIFDALSVH